MSRSGKSKRREDSDSDEDRSKSTRTYADGYDEHFRGNADDRTWLKQLSEREREAELLKRHEARESLKHREEISKRLESSTKKSKLTDDTDIYADDDEDDDYRSTNQRRQKINVSKQKETPHSKTLEALIEQRKKKVLPKPTARLASDDERSTKKQEKLNVLDVYSTSESDDDDEPTRDTHRRLRSRSPPAQSKAAQQDESKRKRSTAISTKSQLKAMMLTRFRMEKWCHAPFFTSVARGAFVRINIGQHNGQPVYRICEIRDVVETGKIYNLGSTRTNKGLRLKHGSHERVFRLEFVSNKEISDSEFKRWRETTLGKGIALPSLECLEKKIEAIGKCKHYVLNDADITKIVEEKSRFRKAPINYAVTKNELLKEIEIAKDDNDAQRESELKKKFDETEERASELDRRRSENISVMALINRRNRKSTQNNVESALVREAQEHRNMAADPFTRRRCAPILVSRVPQTKDELIRELQARRAQEEADVAAKKKAEEKRLLAAKSTSTRAKVQPSVALTTDSGMCPEKILSAVTMHERGSFTSFSDNTDEMFTSHDFELDFAF